jgi:uncharacterized integral membrane protein (TIGR00698 family)
MVTRAFFLMLLIFAAIPSRWMSPPAALVLGVIFGLTSRRHPFAPESRKASKFLLQAAVVALGFSMDLHEVIKAGRSGFIYTLFGITFALVVGMALGRALKVRSNSAYLISVGTAICGGSAIAAVGPVIDASDEEMSVSIGTVFLLNAVGLLLFPPLGHQLGLSQNQFGLWAALAIHDTSSVVGAGAKYGAIALTVATTVKLARALWIVPLTLATAALRAKGHVADAEKQAARKIQWPWFIALFLLAALMNTYVKSGENIYPWLGRAGHIGLTVTLFLIGSAISLPNLKKVGVRPLVQGVLLWAAVALTTLWCLRNGWIS